VFARRVNRRASSEIGVAHCRCRFDRGDKASAVERSGETCVLRRGFGDRPERDARARQLSPSPRRVGKMHEASPSARDESHTLRNRLHAPAPSELAFSCRSLPTGSPNEP
jgi:hypothetical protein